MNELSHWLSTPQWEMFGHHISPGGILAFVACVVAGFLISRALQSKLMRRLFTRLGVDSSHAAVVTTVLGFLAFIGLAVLGLQAGGVPIAWTVPIPGLSFSVLVLFRLLFLLAFVFWLSSVLKHFFLSHFLSTSGLNRALQYAIAQIVGYVILIIGAALSLQNAGIDLSALAFLAGAIGVGVGFGLQNIASNFISGIILLIERPVEIGDRVEIGDVAGTVTEIRARSTTVLTNDNISMIVPNSKLVEDTVTNWTHSDPKIRFRVPIGVAYGSDVAKVEGVLMEVAREHPKALSDPPPAVFFDGFGDNSLNFELCVWSEEMSYRPRRFRSDLNFAIERKLREAGIEIPFPQRDVWIRSAPASDRA
ncbi:hypothetical protein BH09VER1_BH09VER1_04870 [soil metagenome]